MESLISVPYPSPTPSSPNAGPSNALTLRLSSANAPTKFTDAVLSEDKALVELVALEKTLMRNKRADMAIVQDLPYTTTAVTSELTLHEWLQKELNPVMDESFDVSFSLVIRDVHTC